MTDTVLQIVSITGLFVLIFVSGFWLTFTGKPYHMLVITVHKLISVGVLVYLGYLLYRAQQSEGLGLWLIVTAVIAALSFIAAIATGALLSSDLPPSPLVLTLHFVTPYLTILTSGWMLFLLIRRF